MNTPKSLLTKASFLPPADPFQAGALQSQNKEGQLPPSSTPRLFLPSTHQPAIAFSRIKVENRGKVQKHMT